MTYTEFLLYAIDYDRQHHKERPGQSAFNALWRERPDLADKVGGTELDPFYEDWRLPAFWAFLEASW